MMIKKYRKKPVVIEAIKWDGKEDTYREITELLAPDYPGRIAVGAGDKHLYIDTLEGTHEAKIGDYIIRGIKGEVYPCKPDIFEQTYEEVKNEKDGHT